MPSPFPGMDPYLEDPRLWPDVHHRLISVIAEMLLTRIRPSYFVQVQERVYLSDQDDPGHSYYVPDVHLVETAWPSRPGGQATAVIDASILVASPVPLEVREPYLEVQDTFDRSVITVIEVLSSSNKVPGANGLKSYCDKRDAILKTSTQFVDIDLLRGGQRPRWLRHAPQPDYVAHASVEAGKPEGRLWKMRLEEHLKTIGIPLKHGEPPAPLDLQAVLNTVYDRAGYDLVIDYTAEPTPRFTPRQATWAYAFLKDKVAPPKPLR
jgi:hypothetical protein